jgi:hypothetical protein
MLKEKHNWQEKVAKVDINYSWQGGEKRVGPLNLVLTTYFGSINPYKNNDKA